MEEERGTLLPEEEAPTSLLDTQLGDAEVDLFLEGTWTSSLSGGFGWSRDNRSNETRFSTFPDMTDGFSFSQIPELTLSLWIMDRFFFETKISEEEKLETFLFGYNGKEGELLQQVRAGNTDLGHGDFGFLSLPEASKDSFGSYGLLQSESTEHHIALRFDPAGKETVHYRGYNIIEEQRIDPAEMLNGRFFILPDKDIDSITVYMEDGGGNVTGTYPDGEGTGGEDSSFFRILKDDEVTVSRAEGLVFLTEPARGKLAVYYEKSGKAVASDASMGGGALCGTKDVVGIETLDLDEPKVDFYWGGTIDPYMGQDLTYRRIDLSDQTSDGLILYRPGQWSPFELRGVYDLGGTGGDGSGEISTGSGGPPLRLVPKGGTEGNVLSYTSFEGGLVRITGGGEIRSHEGRYPLIRYMEDNEILYGPYRPDSPQPTGKELLYEERTPVGSFSLGSGVLEGSIEIVRNGVPEHRYTFNPDTGEIHFFVPVSHSERIDISYRAAGSGFTEGELIAVSANSIDFTENLSGSLNVGMRWNVTDASYTEEHSQAGGSVLAAGGTHWEGKHFSLALDGGISLESPDTTGLRRFLGMDGGGLPVAFTLETLYPGAPGDYGVTGPTAGPVLVHPDKRGELLYREMYSRSFTGNYSLQHYSWEPPADQVYDYGERVGPYPAATGPETEGDAMVMEYKLGTEQWAGGLVPLINGEDPLDLSRMKAVTFRMKHLGPEPGSTSAPEGDVDIYLIFGRLPEDLDGDGKIDEESSRYSGGFAFNHEPYGTIPVAPHLPWAPDQSMRNGEDLDGNDVLDSYPQSEVTVVKYAPAAGVGDFDPPAETGAWNRVTLSLSAEERRKLAAVSAVQVVVVESSAVGDPVKEASGRLLISELSFLGSSFARTEGEVEVYEETLHEDSAETGGDYEGLTDYDEAALFNDTGDGRARVSDFEYPVDTAGIWRTRAYGKPVDLGDYGKISFFMKADETVEEVSLSVRNPAGVGLAVSFDPAGSSPPGTWSRYTWELDSAGSAKVTKEGTDIPSSAGDYSDPPATPTKNRNAEGVNRIDIAVEHSAAAGTAVLKLDEIYFHDPRTEIAGAGRSQFHYHRTGVLLGSDEKPIIHNLTYENQVQLQNRNFASGFIEPSGGQLSFSNDLSFDFFEGGMAFSYSGVYGTTDFFPSGGYDFTLPFFGGALTINEAYRENHTRSAVEVDHSSAVDFRRENLGSLLLSSSLSRNSLSLTREWRWRGSLSAAAGPTLSLSGEYEAENPEDGEHTGSLMTVDSLPGRYGSSFALYLPDYTRGEISRDTGHEMQLSGKIIETGLGFSAVLNTSTEAGEEQFLLSEDHTMGITARSRLAPQSSGDPSLSLSYTRTLKTQNPHGHPETGGFTEDIAEALERGGNQLYFWSSIPLTELWNDNSRSSFTRKTEQLDSADYTPSVSARFSLTPGSRLRNLILPANLQVEAFRKLSRSYDSLTDALSITGSYRTTALNLFGSLGRYSLISWYRTEEISHSASLSSTIPLSDRMSGDSIGHTLTFGQFLELQLDRRSSVTGDTEYKLSFPESTQKLTIEAAWNRTRPYEKEFPFKDRLELDETPDIGHKETLDINYESDPPAESRKIRFLLSHTTSLIMGERGKARIFGRLGYERSVVDDEYGGDNLNDVPEDFIVHTFGGELGMEIKLTF